MSKGTNDQFLTDPQSIYFFFEIFTKKIVSQVKRADQAKEKKFNVRNF